MNTYVVPFSAFHANLTTIGGKGMNGQVSKSL